MSASEPKDEGQGTKPFSVRLVVQQCLNASLKLSEKPGDRVTIDRGMVVFVCFMNGAEEKDAIKAAKQLLKVRLCESEASKKRVTATERAAEILVVPQASLGGKFKSKSIQYHGIVEKTLGLKLYDAFCHTLEHEIEAISKNKVFQEKAEPKIASSSSSSKVGRGIYGARQVLSMNTNGPYTHIIDI